MMHKITSLLLAPCILAGMTACNSPWRHAQIDYTPVFEKTSCPFILPRGQSDGRTVECGDLIVPEDRYDPDTRTIRLAVAIFHPIKSPPEPDPIIYLQGGPGASILEIINSSFQQVYAPLLAADRDLILFDQRGVGFSEPALDCPGVQERGLELLDMEMEGQVFKEDDLQVLFNDAYRTCHQDLSGIADLGDYNTLNSAADVNDLRIALGYDQVNLWGASYGTRLALEMMRDDPQAIRSVILDSVYPPEKDLYLEAPANLDRAMRLLFDACAADEACNAAYPDLRQTFFDTAAALDENPARLVVEDPQTGQSYPMLFTGGAFFGLIFQLMYETEALPFIPALIYETRLGNLDVIGRIYGQLLPLASVSSRGMMFSVQCNEEIAFSTVEQYEQVLLDHPDIAPYLQDSVLGDISYDVCSFWEAGKADDLENEAVESNIPTLILQGMFDPVTPPAWSMDAANSLHQSHYYLFSNVAHGVSPTDCGQEMMINFFLDPEHAPSDTCIAEMEALDFLVPGE
jgi:pimeloyl-ACP methyl ester carboxylesterase